MAEMNWKKIKEMFPKVHDEVKLLESENIHYDNRDLIEIYHKRKGEFLSMPFTDSLKRIENKL